MKVLVTGATGFVGSHVVRQLDAKGHTIRLLVRDVEKAERFFCSRGLSVDDIVLGSVSQFDAVDQALIDCDAVVHAAALTPLTMVDEDEMLATNVTGVKHVLGAASARGIQRIVHVSSVAAIFDTNPNRLNSELPIAKSNQPYAKSKALAEHYVRDAQNRGVPIKSVYPGGIIGPDDPGFSASMMALRYRVLEGFRITSNGAQQVDVRDLAKVIVALIEEDPCPNHYLVAGHYMTWTELADLIEEVSGAVLKRIHTPGWFLRLVGHYYDLKRRFGSVDSPISAETMRFATLWPKVENSRTLSAMGLELRPARDTFRDTLRWMVSENHIDPSLVPKLVD